jgi:hypothetical protein
MVEMGSAMACPRTQSSPEVPWRHHVGVGPDQEGLLGPRPPWHARSRRASDVATQTCNKIRSVPSETPANAARRPQWRGERRAVMVRLTLPTAGLLLARAEASGRSVSDTAAELISTALTTPGGPV